MYWCVASYCVLNNFGMIDDIKERHTQSLYIFTYLLNTKITMN